VTDKRWACAATIFLSSFLVSAVRFSRSDAWPKLMINTTENICQLRRRYACLVEEVSAKIYKDQRLSPDSFVNYFISDVLIDSANTYGDSPVRN
jgi:hypothetical protein